MFHFHSLQICFFHSLQMLTGNLAFENQKISEKWSLLELAPVGANPVKVILFQISFIICRGRNSSINN